MCLLSFRFVFCFVFGGVGGPGGGFDGPGGGFLAQNTVENVFCCVSC